ncbi:uncharacterized protein [Branchiostoma lanceolatum]|uniref:uncharacterized protein n=1 Tax=Branchiostoma lanceolatum TaxID=7740 RepID=UPI0034555436
MKHMSTAHLTTPAFTAAQYDYVPAKEDHAYAEGIGADDDSPAPPPVANRPPAPPPVANRPPLALNNEERRTQATDSRHETAMEMRSRMRPELRRQDRIEGRARGDDDLSRDSAYTELKYGYLPLNTRDTSTGASATADTAVADK